MTEIPPPTTVRDRLRTALPSAMKARDRTTVAALRSALGAIDNAEAVDASRAPQAGEGDSEIAGAVVGLGAGEVARRELSAAQMAAIVQGEVDDRRTAADEVEAAGHPDRAADLRAGADVLATHLAAG